MVVKSEIIAAEIFQAKTRDLQTQVLDIAAPVWSQRSPHVVHGLSRKLAYRPSFGISIVELGDNLRGNRALIVQTSFVSHDQLQRLCLEVIVRRSPGLHASRLPCQGSAIDVRKRAGSALY